MTEEIKGQNQIRFQILAWIDKNNHLLDPMLSSPIFLVYSMV